MQKAPSYPLNSLSARKHGAVNSIDNWSGADHAATEIPAVKSLNSVLSSLNAVELEVDIALAIWIEGDMHDMTILFLGLGTDVVLELLLPVLSGLPIVGLAMFKRMQLCATGSA